LTAPSDRELIAECLKDAPAAWELLLTRYKRLIYSITVRFGFEMEDRHELFQKVCVEILRSLPSLREVSSLRSWIVTITIRQCNDYLRGKYRDRSIRDLQLANPVVDTLRIYAESDREAALRDAIASLPTRCRILIERLFLQDEKATYEETARELGLSKDSLGSARQRCLEQLRKILQSAGNWQ